MGGPFTGDQDGLGIEDQIRGRERAVVGLKTRDAATHRDLLLVLGEQQAQSAKIDAGKFRERLSKPLPLGSVAVTVPSALAAASCMDFPRP